MLSLKAALSAGVCLLVAVSSSPPNASAATPTESVKTASRPAPSILRQPRTDEALVQVWLARARPVTGVADAVAAAGASSAHLVAEVKSKSGAPVTIGVSLQQDTSAGLRRQFARQARAVLHNAGQKKSARVGLEHMHVRQLIVSVPRDKQHVLRSLGRVVATHDLAAPTPQTASTSTLAAACGTSWTPNGYNVVVRENTNEGTRYVRQRFQWTSARMANLKCLSDTLEPSLVQDATSGSGYLSWNTVSWASNLPEAYLDTRFMDSGDYWDYTVGSGDIDRARADTEYYTLIKTQPNANNSGRAKVNFQRGHRSGPCSIVGYPLCVFGDQTVKLRDWFSLPTPVPARNPYTATGVCGSSYTVGLAKHDLGGTAVVHLRYAPSTGRKCAVTIKTTKVGVPSSTETWLRTATGAWLSNKGDYQYYAGPVRTYAKGQCVQYAGGHAGFNWTSGLVGCSY